MLCAMASSLDPLLYNTREMQRCKYATSESSGRTLPACVIVATTLCNFDATMKLAEVRLYVRCGATGEVTPICSVERGPIVVHDIFEWNVCADISLLFSAPPKASSPLPEALNVLLLVLCDKSICTSSYGPVAPEFDGAIGTLELSANDLVSYGESGRWYPLSAHSGLKRRWRPRRGSSKATTYANRVVGEVLISFSSVQDPAADVELRPSDLARRVTHSGVNRVTKKHKARSIVDNGGGVSNVAGAITVPLEECPITLQRLDDANSVSKNPPDLDLVFYIHVWDALVPACRRSAALYLTIRILRRGEPETRVSTTPVRSHPSLQHDQSYSGGNDSQQSGGTMHFPLVSNAAAASACGAGSMIHVVFDKHLTFSVNGISASSYHSDDTKVEVRLSDASAHEGTVPWTTTVLAISTGEPLSLFAERARCRGATFFNSTTPPMPTIPDATVYNLNLCSRSRASREKTSTNGDGEYTYSSYGPRVSESNVADGGDVKVRMASLVLSRTDPVAHADDVNEFLQRKAKVPRVPKGFKGGRPGFGAVTAEEFGLDHCAALSPATSRRAVGGGRFTGLEVGKRERGVLDLWAASDLFHKYATNNVNRAQDDPVVADVPRVVQHERSTQIDTGKDTTNAAMEDTSTEKMLTMEALTSLADEHFPGVPYSYVSDYNPTTLPLTHAKWNGTHSETTKFAKRLDEGIEWDSSVSINNYKRCDGRGHTFAHLSRADFFSWLRKLPEDFLQSAGLFVRPEAALHKTEEILSESAEKARELSNTIAASLGSTGRIRQGVLRSTGENAAVDRVRLGWAEEDGKILERDWKHHTRLIQKDADLLANALKVAEDDAAREAESSSGIADATTRRASDITSSIKVEETTDLDLVVDSDNANESKETTTANMNIRSIARPQLLQGRVGQVKTSVVALHIQEQAAKLALAAEHLKEVFECVRDNKLCQTNSDNVKPYRWSSRSCSSWARDSRAIASPAADTDQSPSNVCGDQRGSLARQRYCIFQQRRRHYRLLGKYVEKVTSLLIYIATVRRRAAALAKGEENRAKAYVTQMYPNGDGKKAGVLAECLEDPAPRSALALVKRIRRTQEGFRRPAVVASEPTNFDVDVHVLTADNESSEIGHDQVLFMSPTSSEDEASRCASLNGVDIGGESVPRNLKWDSDNKVEGFQRESAGSCHSEEYVIPAAGGGIPHRGRRRPSCLRRINERLDLLRSAFDSAREVNLPPAVANATAEMVMQLGSGGRDLAAAGGYDGIKPSASTAISCPIDRFALHVFRMADAAEGGDSIFTDVQELVGAGGLDTHASGSSLWTTAAQARIVDVERWVVGAVLWQVVEIVKEVDVSCYGEGTGSRIAQFYVKKVTDEGSGRTGGVNAADVDDMDRAGGADIGSENSAVLSTAISLWEDLRSEAFDLVLAKRPAATKLEGSQAPGAVLDQCPSYVGANGDHNVLAGATRKMPCESRDSFQNALARVDPSSTLLHRYAVSSRSNGFDRALMQALSRTGATTNSMAEQCQGAVSTVAGAGWAVAATRAAVALQRRSQWGGAKSKIAAHSVEEILLFAFVNSGFAKNSNLTVSDIIDAVKVRREREAANECTSGHITVSRNNGFTEYGQEGSSRDECLRQEPPVQHVRPELIELLRAASIARILREKLLRTTATEGEVQQAEAALVRVLDNNQTLESAQFKGGRTALHHAAARGDAWLVRLLLERGCEPHLKDFAGKRARDLTRDLQCLRLLGSLKKASPLFTCCRRRGSAMTQLQEEAVEAAGNVHPDHASSRVLARVEFRVEFRLEYAGFERQESNTLTNEEGAQVICQKGSWTEGVVRWVDLRHKILYIEEMNLNLDEVSMVAAADERTHLPPDPLNPSTTVDSMKNENGSRGSMKGREELASGALHIQYHLRSVLDVKLLTCSSGEDHELFQQQAMFCTAWKVSAAREAVDIAVEAAAQLGNMLRLLFDGIADDLIVEVVDEKHSEELAAKATAALEAAAAAAKFCQTIDHSELHGTSTGQRSNPLEAQIQVNDVHDTAIAARQWANTAAGRTTESRTVSTADAPHGAAALAAQAVTPGVATTARLDDTCRKVTSQLKFECTAIAAWVSTKNEVAGAAALEFDAELGLQATGFSSRKRKIRRALVKLGVQDGECSVTVRGRSYLSPVTMGERRGREVIDLERGDDAAVHGILNEHGVSLAACLQTFDVMQDMEDPEVVLGMLASGICQLSEKFVNEGIVFNNLEASAQDALKEDVLRQLRHARQTTPVNFPEWEELKVTMRAYGGITSVTVVMGAGLRHKRKADEDEEDVMVIVPNTSNSCWSRPEDCVAALGIQRSPRLPESAISLVSSLAHFNLCEVLGSLRFDKGVDRRLAFIGYCNQEGEGGRETGESFRCALEVAWDLAAGGVFVKQFSMESDEEIPRFSLRALGVRGFSIGQLPVTLEDIDAVWEYTDANRPSKESEESDNQTESVAQMGSTAEELSLNGATALLSSSPDDGNSTASSSPPSDYSKDGEENCSSSGGSKSDQAGLLDPQPVDRVSKSQPEAKAVASPPSLDVDTSVPSASPAHGEEREDDAGNDQLTCSNLATSPAPQVLETFDNVDERQEATGSLQPAILSKYFTDDASLTAVRAVIGSSQMQDIDDKAKIPTESDGSSQQGGEEDTIVVNGHLTPANVVGKDNASQERLNQSNASGDDGSVGSLEGTDADGGNAVVSAKKDDSGGHRGTSKDALESHRTTADDDEVFEAAAKGIYKSLEGPDHSSDKCSVAVDEMDQCMTKSGSRHGGTTNDTSSKDEVAGNPMESAEIIGKSCATVGNVGTGAAADSTTFCIESDQVHDDDLGAGPGSPQEDHAITTVSDAEISTKPAVDNEGVGSETSTADAGPIADDVYSQPAAKDTVESWASDGRVGEALAEARSVRGEDQQGAPTMCDDTPPLISVADDKVDSVEAIVLGARMATCAEGKGDELIHHTASFEGPKRRYINRILVGNDTRGGSDDPQTGNIGSADQRGARKSKCADTLKLDQGKSADGTTDSAVEELVPVDSLKIWRFPCFLEASVVFFTAAPDEEDVECTAECGVEINHQPRPAAMEEIEKSASKGENCEAGDPSYGAIAVDTLAKVSGWRSIYCVYKFHGKYFLPPRKIDLEDDDAQDRLEYLLREYELSMENVLGHFHVETDLACDSAVINAFTESIHYLQLQRSGSSSADGKCEEQRLNEIENIRTAVEEALGGPPEWAAMHTTVEKGRVIEITIINTSKTGYEGGVVHVKCLEASTSPDTLRAHALAGGIPASAMDVLQRAGLLNKGAINISCVLAKLAEGVQTTVPECSEDDHGARGPTPGVYPGKRHVCLSLNDMSGPYEQLLTADVNGTTIEMQVQLKLGASDAPDGEAMLDGNVTVPVSARVSRLKASADRRKSQVTRPSSPRVKQPLIVTAQPQRRELEDAMSTDKQTSLDISSNVVDGNDNRNDVTVGCRVEARFRGKGEWYPGVLRAVHQNRASLDGICVSLPTVDVEYDDGDTEKNVPRVRVRLPGQKQPRLLNKGAEVDVKRGKRIELAHVVCQCSGEENRYDLKLLKEPNNIVKRVSRGAIMALHNWPPGSANSPEQINIS